MGVVAVDVDIVDMDTVEVVAGEVGFQDAVPVMWPELECMGCSFVLVQVVLEGCWEDVGLVALALGFSVSD